MYVIGLTGNIATGKSTVARLLRDCGAETIDADHLVHELMAPGTPVWEGIRATFGPQVVRADETIDRRRLGAIVFRDPQALARLEAIVHPAVRVALLEPLAELERRPQPPLVVVIEAIKLVEGGLLGLCDALWVVTAPREVQIERLMRTRRLTAEEAAARIDAQPPIEPKLAMADVVIVNDGSLEHLERQVWQAWDEIPGVGRARKGPDEPVDPDH
jgi:dephospho-CoA kinase